MILLSGATLPASYIEKSQILRVVSYAMPIKYPVEILNISGIPKEKLKSIGSADSKPILPNRDNEGNVIPNNRAQNRRVEININKYN